VKNGASKPSSYLDAGGWLFAVIEALTSSGKPEEVAHLPNTSGGWKLNDIGRGEQIAEVISIPSSGAAQSLAKVKRSELPQVLALVYVKPPTSGPT
jgi:hypothetical protein